MNKSILTAVLVAASLATSMSAHAQVFTTSAIKSLSVYESPNGGCESVILDEIRSARQRILVQAYSFTSPPIYKALAAAKARGVDVRILVDKEARSTDFKGAGARYEIDHGVQIAVDEIAGKGVAHSKVMIIDAGTVITGSYNFSRLAETTNVENLLIFRDSPEVVRGYTKLWEKRAALAQPY
jgi:phosphatidylserine/phosphatidylglycerophosphate/cardiolipin synthase-like enzyme